MLSVLLVLTPIESFAAEPRVSLQLFKYSAIHDGDEEVIRQFESFTDIIRAKISSISEELSSSPHFSELQNLNTFLPKDENGKHVKWSGSNADLMARWKSSSALEIFIGRIRVADDHYSVRSEVFFGDLKTSLNSRFIKIDLPIEDEQFDTTRDSHSVAILYALAMDARQRCRPEYEVIELLSAAKERLADVPSSVTGVEGLRSAVNSGLEEPQTCSEASQ